MAEKYFKLNGVAVASPSNFTGEANNLDSDSTTRLESGYMFIKRIRTGIRQFPITWPSLNDDEIKEILDIIDNPDIIYVDITYKDAHYGVITKTFYISDTSWEIKAPGLWTLTCTVTEK